MKKWRESFKPITQRSKRKTNYFSTPKRKPLYHLIQKPVYCYCLNFIDPLHKWRLSLNNNKHLMTGPEGNSEFCFPRISMFPETKSRETLRFEGNKIHWSPRDQSLSDLLYSKTKTKRKQILNNALRFQQQRSTFRGQQ